MALTRDQIVYTDADPEPAPVRFGDLYRSEALAHRVTLGELYRERADLRAEVVTMKRQLVAAGVRVEGEWYHG